MEETPLLVQPDPADPRLTRRVTGIDQTGAPIEASVTVERPLTLYLNGQEIVTMMTILDRPEDLALGYLLNQGMLRRDDTVTGVEYDDDLQVVVVRTERRTDYEAKLKKKTLTSGCAQGTAFGDLLEDFSRRACRCRARYAPPASTACCTGSTRCRRCIWRPARSMAARCASRTGRWSIWRMSAGTTRWTRSPAGCSATPATRRTRSSTPRGG